MYVCNDVILLISFFFPCNTNITNKILIETMEDKCVNCSQSEATSCFSRFQSNRKNCAQHFYYYQNSIKRLSVNRLVVNSRNLLSIFTVNSTSIEPLLRPLSRGRSHPVNLPIALFSPLF